jgi:acetoin utilization deacetylase AcuC-like enzyme
MWHDPGPVTGVSPAAGAFQPGLFVENAETKRRLKNLLDAYEVTPQLQSLVVEPATDEMLLRFHTQAYLDRVRELSEGIGGDAGETALVGPGSDGIARLSAGGIYAAIQAVLKGEVGNAYSLCRPPGHHAERDQGRGFCLYNNIGVAILEAEARGLVERVAVVDWDVHHGNGTQQAFYGSRDVLTISLHQEMLYPVNLGNLEEQGEGAGLGFNINVPLPAGCGGGAYEQAMAQVVEPALRAFQPDLIVVACGYDAAYFDPLSHMLLISTHYRTMTQQMMRLADELCGGRLAYSHEGGYSEFYVPFCGAAVIETLAGINSGIADPYAGTAGVANQALKPHQQEAVQAAVDGPLARCLQAL